MALQILGIEFIILGFMSWMAQLWVQYAEIQYTETTDARVSRDLAPPDFLDFLVALADLTRALTHTPPYIALTLLGILLIALGTALSKYSPKA